MNPAWVEQLPETVRLPVEECSAYAVDGRVPAVVLQPPDREGVSAVMRAAHQADATVIPWGGGTQMALGDLPTRLDAVVSLARLDRLVEYTPEDLTITVEAGMTLGTLNCILAEQNHFLPLDPPILEQATVGGTLAADVSGPLRTRYGTARDLILGSKVVLADGTPVKVGGRVVKNVAGYDLSRLWVGSLGSLAILTEATFKVYPLPEKRATVIAAFSDVIEAAAFAAGSAWNSGSALEALELLSPKAATRLGSLPVGRWLVLTRFAGIEAAVRASVYQLTGEGEHVEEMVSEDEALWEGVCDLSVKQQEETPEGITFKVGVLPTEIGQTCQWLMDAVQGKADLTLTARVPAGLIFAHLSAEEDAARLAGWLEQAREKVRAARGHLIITSAPPAVKEHLSVWGPVGETFDLMQRLKEEFDPLGLLCPGRFVGRI